MKKIGPIAALVCSGALFAPAALAAPDSTVVKTPSTEGKTSLRNWGIYADAVGGVWKDSKGQGYSRYTWEIEGNVLRVQRYDASGTLQSTVRIIRSSDGTFIQSGSGQAMNIRDGRSQNVGSKNWTNHRLSEDGNTIHVEHFDGATANLVSSLEMSRLSEEDFSEAVSRRKPNLAARDTLPRQQMAGAQAATTFPGWGVVQQLVGTWVLLQNGEAVGVSEGRWIEPGRILRIGEFDYSISKDGKIRVASTSTPGTTSSTYTVSPDGSAVHSIKKDAFRRTLVPAGEGLMIYTAHPKRRGKTARWEYRRIDPALAPQLKADLAVARRANEAEQRAHHARQVEQGAQERANAAAMFGAFASGFNQQMASMEAERYRSQQAMERAVAEGERAYEAQQRLKNYQEQILRSSTSTASQSQQAASNSEAQQTQYGSQAAAQGQNSPQGVSSAGGGSASDSGSADSESFPMKSVNVFFQVAMKVREGNTRNPMCFSNVFSVTIPFDPKGWGNAGRLGSAVEPLKSGFVAKCSRLGTVEGSVTYADGEQRRTPHAEDYVVTM